MQKPKIKEAEEEAHEDDDAPMIDRCPHAFRARPPFSSLLSPANSLHVSISANSLAPQVVHVVESSGEDDGGANPASYVSLFSATPGGLEKEVEAMKSEEFSCGRSRVLDLVTFRVEYGCWSSKDSREGWSDGDVPLLRVESDTVADDARVTRVSIDTRTSTRWTLAINTEEIEDFRLGGEPLGPRHPIFSSSSSSPSSSSASSCRGCCWRSWSAA